jgi:hypothetical protein
MNVGAVGGCTIALRRGCPVNRERWRVREEEFFWFCGGGFGEWSGIWAGDSPCCCAAAFYGLDGFAGWGGEDDAVVAGGGAGGFGG